MHIEITSIYFGVMRQDLLMNSDVSVENLQRVRHADRGLLLLLTPGLVPTCLVRSVGTCMCSTVETSLYENCFVFLNEF